MGTAANLPEDTLHIIDDKYVVFLPYPHPFTQVLFTLSSFFILCLGKEHFLIDEITSTLEAIL